MVYLIHFNEKLKHAQHYVGFTKVTLEERIKEHRNGSGARLMSVIKSLGIEWSVVKTWPDADRTFERALKNTNNTKHYCPICNGGVDRNYNPKYLLNASKK